MIDLPYSLVIEATEEAILNSLFMAETMMVDILEKVKDFPDEIEGLEKIYVIESDDRGWRALFGYYTPTLQPPEVIPRQVQCLRWLLASEERKLETVPSFSRKRISA